MESFKVGDKVVCVDDSAVIPGDLIKGGVYTVTLVNGTCCADHGGHLSLKEVPLGNFFSDRFKPLSAAVVEAKNDLLTHKLNEMTPKERKESPLFRGLFKYFPDALVEVAHVSFVGNQQHNIGQEMHWDKSKSTDDGDAMLRHQIQAGTMDSDGLRHSAKVAWRALAQLQREIEGGSK